MNRNKYLPSLVCGFGAAAITTIPGFKTATCCLFVPLAAALSLFLYQKANRQNSDESGFPDEKIKVGTAILTGLLTGIFMGLFATLFDVVITLFTHSNEFVQTLPQSLPEMESMMKELKLQEMFKETSSLLKSMANDIIHNGFSLLYTTFVFLSNIVVDSIFGMLGGLLGLLYVNRKTPGKQL